jgi:hypothetical protein
MESPFDPINNLVTFKIEKQPVPHQRSIWLGACLYNVVRGLLFQGCQGIGKGTYAIDQGSPYNYNN